MMSLLKELENKFNEIEESNVTGNMDGGAGPIKTPKAFVKDGDAGNLDNDHIEVLGYKKSKKSNTNTTKMESIEDKLEKKINEISYKEYKSDDSRHDYQKVNDSIKKINRMMFEMERIINQSAKLKNEAGVHNGQYWKSTQTRFGKISERMLKVARTLKELSA